MKLLVLGGTVFVGRHIVEAALARGHELTLFTRGQRNPNLFPKVEKLHGDRTSDLSALEGRRWDAAIDTSGYVPRVVGASAGLLAKAVEHYTFISSISVYADPGIHGIDEGAAVGVLGDESVEEVTGETYGPLKAMCEQAVERTMPGRALIIRPGLIAGPHDGTDRFTYWPKRVSAGGEVLAPGSPDAQVQVIDVRDLAEWTVRMVEARKTGVYNATGPEGRLTMRGLLDACRETTRADARFTWVDERFLVEQGVTPFTEMPLWVPASAAGMLAVEVGRARADSLTFRPLPDTIRDTLAWDATRPAELERRGGLTPDREQALLRAWANRSR